MTTPAEDRLTAIGATKNYRRFRVVLLRDRSVRRTLIGMHAGAGVRWRLGNRPALDGLRTFAVGLVLVTHAGVPGTQVLGGAGVTVFFTLSGFLITSLLLEEHEKRGRIRFRDFYWRRALRLMPALVMCVAFAVVVELAVRRTIADLWSVAAAATYTTNLYVPTVGAWPDSLLNHTWSLAVEEQFYLVWPLALVALLRLRRRIVLLLLPYMILGAIALRIVLYEPGSVGHSYVSLVTRADSLLIGAMLAVWMHGRVVQGMRSEWVLPLLTAIVVSAFAVPGLISSTAVAVLTVAVVSIAARMPCGLLSWPVLVWAGRRSYGLYLYHPPIIWALNWYGLPWWGAGPVMLGVAVGVAAVSHRWVEQPVLGLKRARRGATGPPTSKSSHRTASGGALMDSRMWTHGGATEVPRDELGKPKSSA